MTLQKFKAPASFFSCRFENSRKNKILKKNTNKKLTNTGCIVVAFDSLQDARVGVKAALTQLIEVVTQIVVVWIGLDK